MQTYICVWPCECSHLEPLCIHTYIHRCTAHISYYKNFCIWLRVVRTHICLRKVELPLGSIPQFCQFCMKFRGFGRLLSHPGLPRCPMHVSKWRIPCNLFAQTVDNDPPSGEMSISFVIPARGPLPQGKDMYSLAISGNALANESHVWQCLWWYLQTISLGFGPERCPHYKNIWGYVWCCGTQTCCSWDLRRLTFSTICFLDGNVGNTPVMFTIFFFSATFDA